MLLKYFLKILQYDFIRYNYNRNTTDTLSGFPVFFRSVNWQARWNNMTFGEKKQWVIYFFYTNTESSRGLPVEDLTSSLFLEPRKCRATCSGSMLVTSASFQRLISYTFSFCSWTSIFHRKRVRASFSTFRQQHQGLMLAFDQHVDLQADMTEIFCW